MCKIRLGSYLISSPAECVNIILEYKEAEKRDHNTHTKKYHKKLVQINKKMNESTELPHQCSILWLQVFFSIIMEKKLKRNCKCEKGGRNK